MRIDDDAVIWSASETDRAGRPLLLLLHGYNSHEGDLFGLAPYLPLEPVIASLRAPLDAGYGYAWFPLFADAADEQDAPGGTDAPEEQDAPDGTDAPGEASASSAQASTRSLTDAEAATTAVLEWLDRAAPDADRVGLLGFSQGGAMSLELLRREPARFAFAATLAGFALPGERDGDVELARIRPPVFWGRGSIDQVIPAEFVARTQDWLPEHADLDSRIYEGLAHSVSDAELGDVIAWLRARYATA
ncbi:alpha/beta hydrolase [Agromyces sp. MMS24-JH15]|uniref:alpha/beta hydrolase n=1 Tax=Agromyces sp. MMS24-JH15 TaxID=3243765 RepID=UPI003747C163